ncbi:periplasmic binding protein-like II [Xylariaceae sp. FL0804]|nr:periplasmic binding protein-like II [Xylariaceae sp. FL0804]
MAGPTEQQKPLRIGFVPEHFSTPLHFAAARFGLSPAVATLRPFPSGTGHMIAALRAGEIDVGIGLTEAWVAGLGKVDAKDDGHDDGGYRIVGTYVETPLCWAISTGARRPEIASVASLRGSKIGISRPGSGSQVMGYVLADQQGWLSSSSSSQQQQEQPYAEAVVLSDFANLRAAVGDGRADFFMWEHFTSKRYHDAGEIRRLGEIYTPWSSWKIVASTALLGSKPDPRLADLFAALDKGVQYFEAHPDEAVRYISTELDYSEEDAREWLKTVRFASKTEGVDVKVVQSCIDILRKAGVLTEGKGMTAEAMLVGGLGAQFPE